MNTTTSALRWIVRPSGFPWNVPGEPIGTVSADDRVAATKLAESIYGSKVIVEPETSRSEPMQSAAIAAVHATSAMRRMTAIEIQMARAVGVLRFPPAHYKGTIRRLHAESFKSAPEISDDLSVKLRAIVQVMASQLPREVVESVGGAK